MKVPLLDLVGQYAVIKSEVEAKVEGIMASQYFILGPEVLACEKEIAAYSHTSYAVGVSSGTDALLVSLMAEGIKAGDEVITTPYTFFATAGSIARLGAVPVFVDIDPETFNMASRQLADRVNSRTRAIMPVHLFGQMVEMGPIMALAQKHGLVVVEDAAQAIGAEDAQGRRAGSVGDYGCFSFYPTKNLGCFGDGGMVVTKDAKRAEKLAILRDHGSKPRYYYRYIGGNFRLDALQAAVVRIKLQYLDRWTEARQANAARYDRLFTEAGLAKSLATWRAGDKGGVVLPARSKGRHIFNQYVIRVAQRDGLREFLKEKGVGTEVYYPLPLHAQECFAYLGYKPGAFPESERAAQETLAIPIYPELTDDQASYVVETIGQFLARGR